MALIDVAVVYDDGRREVVTVGRPADLIAFAEKFDKIAPSEPYAVAELVWLVHRSLRIDKPVADWLDELADISAREADVAKLRAELNGGASPPTDAAAQPPSSEVESPA